MLPLGSAAKMASIAAHLSSGYDSLDDGHGDNDDDQRSHGGGRSQQPFNAHLNFHASPSGDGAYILNSNPTRMHQQHHEGDIDSGDVWDAPNEWNGGEEEDIDDEDLVKLGNGVLQRLRVERDRAMASEMNEKQVCAFSLFA